MKKSTKKPARPKLVEKLGAQGDLMLQRLDGKPSDCGAEIDRDARGRLILAHSETGHHHVIREKGARMFASPDPLVVYVEMKAKNGTVVEHQREHDTHAPLRFAAGWWRGIRQRERGPQGWQRVAD